MARAWLGGGGWWNRNRNRRWVVSENLVGAEFALEAEIVVLEEDAGVEGARAADGELVERGPASGKGGGAGRAGDELGDDGRDGGGALVGPADGADQGRELGAHAGEPGPVARVVLELEEDVEHDVIGELREHRARHCFIGFSLWILVDFSKWVWVSREFVRWVWIGFVCR